ncbi:response regulator receiver domain protein [Desulfitobacterium hafniense DP7]|uniref:Stage 0 sporulation protein A homolog n=1 Tax=Desulfitobacterium hafniense DP7 TaxID=537010 RepID=G9XUG2_DESHA|nr:response regulator [Desulfitobacterium hafniense]EHL04708.1 response regulator receiver domain protein [Desulfitobacterium hafniense DP7]
MLTAGLNISLCDDGALQRAYVKLIIQDYESRCGVRFNLYEFSSGEELLAKFNENPNLFDLFFLDHRMKKITGLEAASTIRQRNKACHIVFITASEEQEDFAAVSPLRVLNKPAQPAAIWDILDKVSADKENPASPGFKPIL